MKKLMGDLAFAITKPTEFSKRERAELKAVLSETLVGKQSNQPLDNLLTKTVNLELAEFAKITNARYLVTCRESSTMQLLGFLIVSTDNYPAEVRLQQGSIASSTEHQGILQKMAAFFRDQFPNAKSYSNFFNSPLSSPTNNTSTNYFNQSRVNFFKTRQDYLKNKETGQGVNAHACLGGPQV